MNTVEYIGATNASNEALMDAVCVRLKKLARSRKGIFQFSGFLVIVFTANPCTPIAARFLKAMQRNGILVPPEQLASSLEAQEYVVIFFSVVQPSIDPSLYCASLADQEWYRGRRIIMVVLAGNFERLHNI